MSKDTILFESAKIKQISNKEAMHQIYSSLQERGYNAIDQMVGYLTSGDPSYITSHNDARNKIRTIERDELLEKMVKNYIGLEN